MPKSPLKLRQNALTSQKCPHFPNRMSIWYSVCSKWQQYTLLVIHTIHTIREREKESE